jgi:hypothetical protein
VIEKYRIRPVEVEAIVFDGTTESRREIEEWSGIDLGLRIGAGDFQPGDAVARQGESYSIMTGGWLDSHFEKVQ